MRLYGSSKNKKYIKQIKCMKFNSTNYWKLRYKNGGLSGNGSYASEAKKKADYINSVIRDFNIKSINDIGHGDGNQLKYIEGFKDYTGYDVSEHARQRCLNIHGKKKGYRFISDTNSFNTGDLAMSLDVIYHLVEQDTFESYMDLLFSLSQYVLIYSTDMDNGNSGSRSHVYHRNIKNYISKTFINFKLIDNVELKPSVYMMLYKKSS